MSTPRWFYAQDDNRLGPVAVEQIAQQYPPESVSLYLNTLLSQDSKTWEALGALLQEREKSEV